MAQRSSDFLLSVLIPVFNEEGNVALVYEQLIAHISTICRYEIIFIDDGSSDNTLEAIKELQQVDQQVHFLCFSRNFGHQSALKAGLDYCNGDVIVSMDGDLQHPPQLIPQMIECWQKGAEIVYTRRVDGEETSWFKRNTSGLYYKLISSLSSIHLQPGAADFRLIDKEVLKVIRRFQEADIFFRGLVAWVGFRQCEIPYLPAKRRAGATKYTLRKMIRLALNGLLGFSVFPLRVASVIGFLVSLLSFAYGIYAIWMRFFGDEVVSGWASVMTGIYFLGGMQLICLGICGEYIGKIFIQVKQRPHYILRETSLTVD